MQYGQCYLHGRGLDSSSELRDPVCFENRSQQTTNAPFGCEEVKVLHGEEEHQSAGRLVVPKFSDARKQEEGLEAGWTASFLAKVYPSLSRNLIKEFLQAVVEVTIVELLALFVAFGAENSVRGPVILLTEGVQNLRLDGLLTLIAITHGNLGGLMNLTRYLEQMRENVRRIDVKRPTDSWNKIRDLRHTLIQYLLQQNCFGTGEDETIQKDAAN